MKDIKEKPTERVPRSNTRGNIPKAALKKAWTEAKEKSRNKLRESTSTREDDNYTAAPDTGVVLTDTSRLAIKQNTDFTVQQGRKFARKQIEKYRVRHAAESVEATRVHTASERGVSPKQVECGTLPDAEQHPRRGADFPRQRAKEKVVTAKTAPRDIRGVTQGQRQLRTAANETVRSITTQAQMQTRAQKIQLAAQKAAGGTGRTAVAVRSAIRHFLASLHSLVVAVATGISVALSIIIVISLVAFVSGSAYGIFFAADAPNAASVTVREAVETLTAEYRDRLEEISDTVQHDRQDITANDDVYYIRWQDVLAVFSSYVAGSEQGAPVAALTENQVDKLREIMWAMNAVDYSTRAETAVIEKHNLERIYAQGLIEDSQYLERKALIEKQLYEKKEFLTRKPLDGNIDRLLKNTRQIKRLLGTCQPLMYFDKQVFTSLVSKVTISDTSFEFELINGMRVSERRTSR